jgi:WD40 repeat protein
MIWNRIQCDDSTCHVAFSHDGHYLALVSPRDVYTYIVHVESGQVVKELKHDYPMYAATWHPWRYELLLSDTTAVYLAHTIVRRH